jgi:hypothetical protein
VWRLAVELQREKFVNFLQIYSIDGSAGYAIFLLSARVRNRSSITAPAGTSFGSSPRNNFPINIEAQLQSIVMSLPFLRLNRFFRKSEN